MELAVNTWRKGLLLDTNPMIQGNDTLSDALNATITTADGDEIILQNDMGNRKVDRAYLPEGYVPVGMKEYGGIIYVAAYNPTTKMSLIGSFPSPELYLDEEHSYGNSNDSDDNKFNLFDVNNVREESIVCSINYNIPVIPMNENPGGLDINETPNYSPRSRQLLELNLYSSRFTSLRIQTLGQINLNFIIDESSLTRLYVISNTYLNYGDNFQLNLNLNNNTLNDISFIDNPKFYNAEIGVLSNTNTFISIEEYLKPIEYNPSLKYYYYINTNTNNINIFNLYSLTFSGNLVLKVTENLPECENYSVLVRKVGLNNIIDNNIIKKILSIFEVICTAKIRRLEYLDTNDSYDWANFYLFKDNDKITIKNPENSNSYSPNITKVKSIDESDSNYCYSKIEYKWKLTLTTTEEEADDDYNVYYYFNYPIYILSNDKYYLKSLGKYSSFNLPKSISASILIIKWKWKEDPANSLNILLNYGILFNSDNNDYKEIVTLKLLSNIKERIIIESNYIEGSWSISKNSIGNSGIAEIEIYTGGSEINGVYNDGVQREDLFYWIMNTSCFDDYYDRINNFVEPSTPIEKDLLKEALTIDINIEIRKEYTTGITENDLEIDSNLYAFISDLILTQELLTKNIIINKLSTILTSSLLLNSIYSSYDIELDDKYPKLAETIINNEYFTLDRKDTYDNLFNLSGSKISDRSLSINNILIIDNLNINVNINDTISVRLRRVTNIENINVLEENDQYAVENITIPIQIYSTPGDNPFCLYFPRVIGPEYTNPLLFNSWDALYNAIVYGNIPYVNTNNIKYLICEDSSYSFFSNDGEKYFITGFMRNDNNTGEKFSPFGIGLNDSNMRYSENIYEIIKKAISFNENAILYSPSNNNSYNNMNLYVPNEANTDSISDLYFTLENNINEDSYKYSGNDNKLKNLFNYTIKCNYIYDFTIIVTTPLRFLNSWDNVNGINLNILIKQIIENNEVNKKIYLFDHKGVSLKNTDIYYFDEENGDLTGLDLLGIKFDGIYPIIDTINNLNAPITSPAKFYVRGGSYSDNGGNYYPENENINIITKFKNDVVSS